MDNDRHSVTQEEDHHPNSPELSKSGKVTRRAITSDAQAFAIAQNLEKGNEERNRVDAVVASKYNGSLPYSKSALRANLEDWRSNASFGAMSGIVDRITPAPIQAIDSMKSLTAAKLCYGTPEDEKKSSYFQTEVTATIRSWIGWKDFLASLFQEDVLMGRAAPLNLDPYSPWPKMFHGNEVFFDDGVGQHARCVPCLAAKEDLLIHEFVNFIEDGEEISEAAGWDFDACIKVVNDALPKSPNETNDLRSAEDAIREGNQGASHAGAKVVQLYHVLAVEPDSKKVTHFIVNRDGKHEALFQQEERFESMEDVVTLFCLQPGNGKYYSSKGMGRMLLNACISQERARNSMLDNLNMGGMKILVVPPNSTPSLQTKVMSPFMIVSSDGVFEDHGITSNVKDFIEADNQVSRWMEMLSGSYISGLRGNDDSSDRTATEAEIDAKRDAQARTAFLMRALGQFADLVSQITRRLCDPETSDDLAKELQKRLKDPDQGNLSAEEIKTLANTPAAQVTQDLTSMLNQQVIAAYQALKGNPNFDQYKLDERFSSAVVNPQFTKDIMLDEAGIQASEIEGMRQQQIETEAILAGAPGMPVSPRDPHPIHLKTAFTDLKGGLPKIAQGAQRDPGILDSMNAQLVHTKAHIETWKGQGASPEELKPFEEAQKNFELVLHQIGQSLMQQQQAPQGGAEPAGAPPASPMPQEAAETPNADKEPEAPSGKPSEKLLIAALGQYQHLPEPERQRLEELCGFDAGRAPSGPDESRGEIVLPADRLPGPSMPVAPSPRGPIRGPVAAPPPVAPPEVIPTVAPTE